MPSAINYRISQRQMQMYQRGAGHDRARSVTNWVQGLIEKRIGEIIMHEGGLEALLGSDPVDIDEVLMQPEINQAVQQVRRGNGK